MKTATLNCLIEAYRRWICFDEKETKPLGERWLGLGTPASYREAVKSGYMAWTGGEPRPSVMGWLKLTPKGEEIMRRFAKAGIGEADFNDCGDFLGCNKIPINVWKNW